MRYPTDNRYVSSGYGARVLPSGVTNFHHGADFPLPVGGKLYAIKDFTVIANVWRDLGGWTLAIQFADGVVAWYQHMKYQSKLGVGYRGKEGEVVGTMGTTGRLTTGIHLHFELRRNGISFDPIPYLRAGVPADEDVQPLPTPKPPTPPINKETIAMATQVIVTVKNASGQPIADRYRRCAFVDTESGFVCDLSWLTLADADKWAAQVGMTSGALRFTDAAFDKFIARLGAVRTAS